MWRCSHHSRVLDHSLFLQIGEANQGLFPPDQIYQYPSYLGHVLCSLPLYHYVL